MKTPTAIASMHREGTVAAAVNVDAGIPEPRLLVGLGDVVSEVMLCCGDVTGTVCTNTETFVVGMLQKASPEAQDVKLRIDEVLEKEIGATEVVVAGLVAGDVAEVLVERAKMD
jgi:hypothetical protein